MRVDILAVLRPEQVVSNRNHRAAAKSALLQVWEEGFRRAVRNTARFEDTLQRVPPRRVTVGRSGKAERFAGSVSLGALLREDAAQLLIAVKLAPLVDDFVDRLDDRQHRLFDTIDGDAGRGALNEATEEGEPPAIERLPERKVKEERGAGRGGGKPWTPG